MRLSNNKISQIKLIMKDQFNREVTDEEAQQIGLAVLTFVVAQARATSQIIEITGEHDNEQ